MALTLGTTGMDSATQADVQAAFKMANSELGGGWTLIADDTADYVVVDMDSLYGPMSWLRLHAAGRKVIGLTSVDKSQTDYRLSRPISVNEFTALLADIASNTPAADHSAGPDPIPAPAPVSSTPAPAPGDHMPDPQALPRDEVEAMPATTPAMAAAPKVADPAPEPPPAAPVPPPAPVEPELPAERPLASWLVAGGLDRRVRLQEGSVVLLIDPRSKVYHGPATLKPLTPFFRDALRAEDFEMPEASAWESEAASLGPAQALARLQWLGGLLAGAGDLLPGLDPDGQYRLGKWPQTEREYPKHFRIATAMMKGPSTLDEIAAASGVDRADVADFINANLTTGYAELVLPPPPEPEPSAKPNTGLFGRMRGR